MSEIKVSVIIPTYNRVMFLGETLNSVITQSFSDWECIVVDDGSNDHTAELMEFYTNIDDRILYYQRPEDRPKGANACRNFGLENSKGKYIQWLDSDDIISPDKLEKQYQQLETNNATISFSRWGRLSISGESKIFEQLPVYRNFKSSYQFFEILADSVGYLPNHSYLISREAVIRAGGWFEFLSVNQDGEFMARVISNADKIYFSPDPVAYYRLKTGKNTSEATSKNAVDLINSWKLIEAYLNIRYKEKDLYFINKVKERLFFNFKNLPEILRDNDNFFKEQLRKEPSKITIIIHNLIVKFKVGRCLLKPFKKLRRKIYH
ncbi:hypothetical protein GCM10010465_26700 [Actinomadura fibrosa]